MTCVHIFVTNVTNIYAKVVLKRTVLCAAHHWLAVGTHVSDVVSNHLLRVRNIHISAKFSQEIFHCVLHHN